MPADRHNRAAGLAAIATGAGTSWQPAHGRFYVGLVLRYLVWDVGTSGTNVECGAATELNGMRNRYVQALDLSPGFGDCR